MGEGKRPRERGRLARHNRRPAGWIFRSEWRDAIRSDRDGRGPPGRFNGRWIGANNRRTTRRKVRFMQALAGICTLALNAKDAESGLAGMARRAVRRHLGEASLPRNLDASGLTDSAGCL
jgi:hypothetical protein